MPNNNIDNRYNVKLPVFNGPFDLLLFFIERDELDIYDIPIARITDDFLSYIRHLEKMDVNIASEFILVAATLMRIKSKMLLPRSKIDESGKEVDPREELIAHLLEYKKYKSIVVSLYEIEAARALQESRGNTKDEIQKFYKETNMESELEDLSLYKLMKVFNKVMLGYGSGLNNDDYKVRQYPYTISSQKIYIQKYLEKKNRFHIKEFILQKPQKIFLLYNFLAILELLQLKEINIAQGVGYNNFWVEKNG